MSTAFGSCNYQFKKSDQISSIAIYL
jgi:hypothetical protein